VRRTVLSIVIATVLALAVAACGGSGSTASSAVDKISAAGGSPAAGGTSTAGATSAAATMSAGTHRMKLTAACVVDSRATAQLPVEQQREHLTFAQLERSEPG
jgi:hypothetical protein